MTKATRITVFLALLLAMPASLSSQTAVAADTPARSDRDQDPHAGHRAAANLAGRYQGREVEVQLRDRELLTQNGERLRFKSDVIGERLVAITFTYSTCTTICPIYSALFQQVQKMLGDRIGEEVVLITMTLDPTTDIPPRLRREAKKYQARPGWYFLTGDKADVDQVLKGMDAYFADFTQHPPMALVGDGRSGRFLRVNGFPEPKLLVAMIDELAAARHPSQGHH